MVLPVMNLGDGDCATAAFNTDDNNKRIMIRIITAIYYKNYPGSIP
jgi:hypothetical protein